MCPMLQSTAINVFHYSQHYITLQLSSALSLVPSMSLLTQTAYLSSNALASCWFPSKGLFVTCNKTERDLLHSSGQ